MDYKKTAEEIKKIKKEMSVFLRLTSEGESAVGVFCGEFFTFKDHWTTRSEPCTGDGCELCTKGLRPRARVKVNFLLAEEGQMKIWEASATWFKDVVVAFEEYGTDKYCYKITRTGKKRQEVRYPVTISLKHEITPDLKKMMDLMLLHELDPAKREDKFAEDTTDTDDLETPDDSDEKF